MLMHQIITFITMVGIMPPPMEPLDEPAKKSKVFLLTHLMNYEYYINYKNAHLNWRENIIRKQVA